MDLEALYSYLPVPLQNLACTLEGWRINRKRYSWAFEKILAEYESRDKWSSEQTAQFRDQRLKAFLIHAGKTVPYYRRLFEEIGFDPQGFASLDDLTALPVLSKQTVQAAPQDFTSEAISPSECLISHTSGTTGTGLRFAVTHEAHSEQWAVWWRYRRWHGLDRTIPCLYFGGRSVVPLRQQRPPFWRYNRAGRLILFSAYHLSAQTAAIYLRAMAEMGAPWIHGYPSLISTLAAFSLQLGIRVPGIRWVTLGAESLLPQQSAIITEAFGVRPLEHYGMAEGVANASVCPQGLLHVDEDYAAVEFLPLEEGGGHRIIGTNFTNPAMPLIRYEVGDVAEYDSAAPPCSCGRPGRILAAIDGRKEDFVLTKKGARLGRLDHIFKDQVRIREAQIRQDRPGHMVLLIVKGGEFGEQDEQSLKQEAYKRVGDEVDFELRYVEQLEKTASGKLRFVVSSIKEGQINTAVEL